MPKTKTQPVPEAFDANQGVKERDEAAGNEPLSGSKKIKNRNHSRNNHGEGH